MIKGHKWTQHLHDKYRSPEELEMKLSKVCKEAEEKNRFVVLADLGTMKYYGENVGYFEVIVYRKV